MNNQDLREQLRAGDPAGSVAVLDEYAITDFVARTTATSSNVTPLRRRRGRRIALAASIAAAIALSPVIKFGLQPPISQAAADFLLHTADTIPSGLTPREGQYWKVTIQQWQAAFENESERRSTHIVYSPAFGEGASYIGILEERVPQEDSWYRHSLGKGQGSWQEPTPAFISALPRDVEALRAKLYRDTEGHGSTTDGSAFTYAMDFLKAGQADSELQAILLRVIATIPGVEISTDVSTSDGRVGVGIQHAELLGAYDFLGKIIGDGGLKGKQFILDANTGEVIGERMYWLGQVVFTASRTRELVDEVPADIIKLAWPRS